MLVLLVSLLGSDTSGLHGECAAPLSTSMTIVWVSVTEA